MPQEIASVSGPFMQEHSGFEQSCGQDAAVCQDISARMGNNLLQLAHGIFVSYIAGVCSMRWQMSAIADVDEILSIDREGVLHIASLPKSEQLSPEVRCAIEGDSASWSHTPLEDYWGSWTEDMTQFINSEKDTKLRIGVLYEIVQKHLVPLKKPCQLEQGSIMSVLDNNTVVMHMRSGDLLNATWVSEAKELAAEQPDEKGVDRTRYLMPCSYYERVMEHGNDGKPFTKGWIITEADMMNPCVRQLEEQFPGKIQVQASSILDDSCMIMSARNVACDSSSFAQLLALMNPHLENLHVRDVDASAAYGEEQSAPFRQHIYTLPTYPVLLEDHPDTLQTVIDVMSSYHDEIWVRKI